MVIGEEKQKGTIKCDKSALTFEIGCAHCDNETVGCKKKTRLQPNMVKV